MDASKLTPIYLEEVMPGDMFHININAIARTAVPIVPVMDNWVMTLFAFYTPNRILWEHWEEFMGQQANPGDSIDYLIPQIVSPAGGWSQGTLADWFGLPTEGQTTTGMTISTSALPFRMYNKIWNDWFRDQNIQDSAPEHVDDGPDPEGSYAVLARCKRPDYFTGGLPFVQKGPAVTIPIGTTAPLQSTGIAIAFDDPGHNRTGSTLMFTSGSNAINWSNSMTGAGAANFGPAGNPMPSLEVNLADVAGVAVNTMRTAVATQQLLERDARGGTRYVENIFAHYGVRPPDFRLDRPEYIGGGTIPVNMNAIPQTSATDVTGSTTPQGNLAASGYMNGSSGFTYSATEHGYITVLAVVTADLTYSQGIRRHWNRRTRYDFPFPEFANLGEQAILNKEIYSVGSATGGISDADQDMQPFAYIPRYDECRWFPSQITGLFRPYEPGNLAYWHSSEQFGSLPTLNEDWIQDQTNNVITRNFAGGDDTHNQQFLLDALFTGKVARPLPVYAVPGLTRF